MATPSQGDRATHTSSGQEICRCFNVSKCSKGTECSFAHWCWVSGCSGEHFTKACPHPQRAHTPCQSLPSPPVSSHTPPKPAANSHTLPKPALTSSELTHPAKACPHPQRAHIPCQSLPSPPVSSHTLPKPALTSTQWLCELQQAHTPLRSSAFVFELRNQLTRPGLHGCSTLYQQRCIHWL